jgi:RNA polymerase sigma factor (sigma-70 family)
MAQAPASADHELLERSRDGDREAMDTLLARHLDALHGYLRLQLGPALRRHESSLDLVGSVCREVLEGADRFEYRGDAAFRGWLFRAAENKLRDRARHWSRDRRDERRVVELPEGADAGLGHAYSSLHGPMGGAIVREQIERLEAAFDALDPKERDIILAHRSRGMSYQQIAAEIGQTPHYTRTLLSRALARLSTLLDDA